MTTSSPSWTRCRPKVCATRLIPSVVPRTKTISRVEAAFTKARTFSRACSWQGQAALALHERGERSDGDPGGHVAREGVDQGVPRLLLADPAGTQVEHRGRVELADRRAVPAFDVVREDLERRLRVDQCL